MKFWDIQPLTPHRPYMRFECPLGDILRTSSGCPKSSSQGRPLNVKLRRPLDFISGRPQDVRSGRSLDVKLVRPRNYQIGSLGYILGMFKGNVIGTSRGQSFPAVFSLLFPKALTSCGKKKSNSFFYIVLGASVTRPKAIFSKILI